MRTIFLCSLLFLLNLSTAIAQDATDEAIKVYLDCDDCNESYIKQNIEWVAFVRDRKVADIHLFITTQNMASGGELYYFNVMAAQKDTLSFELPTFSYQTEREVNQELVQKIQAGLLPYAVHKAPLSLQIRLNKPQKVTAPTTTDPWNFWIFEVGGGIDWEKQSNQTEYELEGEIDIERTTEEWRIRSDFDIEYEVNQVQRKDRTISSSLKQWDGEASVVKSLNEQWSAGFFGKVQSSTYNNIALGSSLQAAVEYNFFPYRMSATKEFTVSYMVGPQRFRYWEPTIYDRKEEQLYEQAIRVNFDFQQPWGSIDIVGEGSSFLHDWQKHRLELEANLSLRIVKGLFVRLSADARMIRDQLYLPKGDASLEEILLERKALATDYELELKVGIGYTFGSIYNSIVNTRL